MTTREIIDGLNDLRKDRQSFFSDNWSDEQFRRDDEVLAAAVELISNTVIVNPADIIKKYDVEYVVIGNKRFKHIPLKIRKPVEKQERNEVNLEEK